MYTSSMCKNENAVIKESSEGEKNFNYRGAPQELDPLKRIYLASFLHYMNFRAKNYKTAWGMVRHLLIII